MAVVLALTGRFGLRTGEGRQAADLHLENKVPTLCVAGGGVGNQQSLGDVSIEKKHLQSFSMLAGRVMYTKTTPWCGQLGKGDFPPPFKHWFRGSGALLARESFSRAKERNFPKNIRRLPLFLGPKYPTTTFQRLRRVWLYHPDCVRPSPTEA